MTFPPWLLEIIISPESGQPLKLENDAFVSSNGLRYSIVKDIPCLISHTSTNAPLGLGDKEYYDKLAREYRAQDDFWSNPYDTEIWRLEHDLIRTRLTPGPMLDVGCGFYPHFEFTNDREVVAGDVSFESLLVARKFGDETGSVFLFQFDATALPFAPQSFSSLIAGGELLNHITNYSLAISEFWRVLKPGGILLIQVGAKWCFDSLWAILDSFIGHPLGYSVTKREALSFFRTRNDDVRVTWEITPAGDFQIKLLLVRKLQRTTRELGFKLIDQYGANCLSGLIPLPVQQKSKNRILQNLTNVLIRGDRLVARFPFFRTFAGNVFLICQKID